jgi:hypothetical protein
MRRAVMSKIQLTVGVVGMGCVLIGAGKLVGISVWKVVFMVFTGEIVD